MSQVTVNLYRHHNNPGIAMEVSAYRGALVKRRPSLEQVAIELAWRDQRIALLTQCLNQMNEMYSELLKETQGNESVRVPEPEQQVPFDSGS